jgi:hypothetical protein
MSSRHGHTVKSGDDLALARRASSPRAEATSVSHRLRIFSSTRTAIARMSFFAARMAPAARNSHPDSLTLIA